MFKAGMIEETCHYAPCSKVFPKNYYQQVFCSDECRNKYNNEQKKHSDDAKRQILKSLGFLRNYDQLNDESKHKIDESVNRLNELDAVAKAIENSNVSSDMRKKAVKIISEKNTHHTNEFADYLQTLNSQVP